MTEPLFFATTAIAQNATNLQKTSANQAEVQRSQRVQAEKERLDRILLQLRRVRPESRRTTEFSQGGERPQSGSQLFSQRLSALQKGQVYTQLPANYAQSSWSNAIQQPTYEQWRSLLVQEAMQVQRVKNLGVVLGDSLSLWFPSERLPQSRVWLNQGISGDTTSGILRRLSGFARTRPQIVYVMAGVNDLKNGASDRTILQNLQQIMRQLRQQHPQTQIVMQSILPTRSLPVSSQRMTNLNQQLKAIAAQNGAYYLDVYGSMADGNGYLRPDLTTDGLHLNAKGYEVWQSVLSQAEVQIARSK